MIYLVSGIKKEKVPSDMNRAPERDKLIDEPEEKKQTMNQVSL